MELCVGPASPEAGPDHSTGSLQMVKGTEQRGWAPSMPCSLSVGLKPGHNPEGTIWDGHPVFTAPSTTWPQWGRLMVIEEKDVVL